MHLLSPKKLVVLGMMSKIPVAGVIWQTVHYLEGFRRLGFDVYYVEAHARTPSMFMESEQDDSSQLAASWIAGVMERFGFQDRWAFHALHADSRVYGMSECRLREVYRSAELILNLHGGTLPQPEHCETGRLVFLETDPVLLQIELYQNFQDAIDFLEPHCAYFTFGENYGSPDCLLPVSERFRFHPTRQPVVVDFWQPHAAVPDACFTTIGSWNQPWRIIEYKGETYYWSKHLEWAKFLGLPSLTGQEFELALASYEAPDLEMLEGHGWRVRDALELSMDIDVYRRYVAASRAEFTVAKDQNVRLRSGWFSDRSATYLAAGRPVVTQETGFSNIIPAGEGLLAFSTLEEATDAIQRINGDYERHSRAALAVAREYFNYDVVLPRLLADVGL